MTDYYKYPKYKISYFVLLIDGFYAPNKAKHVKALHTHGHTRRKQRRREGTRGLGGIGRGGVEKRCQQGKGEQSSSCNALP